MEPREKDKKSDLAKVEACALQLGEHFDAVQIFASRHEPTELAGTRFVTFGVGNWYTRYGLTREWVLSEEAKMSADASASKDED
jgi:hypothetical protein